MKPLEVISPVVLNKAAIRLERAARFLEQDAGKVMAETMGAWAREFLDQLRIMAETGAIPAVPPLRDWTIAISRGKQFTYDTGAFWRSMEVVTRHGGKWAEVAVKPTGISSHSVGPRTVNNFPMGLLMAALGYTADDAENPRYQVVIRDPEKVRRILRYLHYRLDQAGYGHDEEEAVDVPTKKKRALIIRVPHRPIIPRPVWDQALGNLATRLQKAVKAEVAKIIHQ